MGMNIIVAMARNRAIGRNGDLIWHLREDLKHFKSLTMGHAVVMGRRTWESLPKGALPGRKNIVISSREGFQAEGAIVCSSPKKAFDTALNIDEEPFVIGGGLIYSEALEHTSRIFLTEVDAEYDDADTFFPAIERSQWRVAEESDIAIDEKSGLRYRFVTLERE